VNILEVRFVSFTDLNRHDGDLVVNILEVRFVSFTDLNRHDGDLYVH